MEVTQIEPAQTEVKVLTDKEVFNAKAQACYDAVFKSASEISTRIGSPVFGIALRKKNSEDIVIGFFKEPNRMAKLAVLDKSMQGAISAATELVDACFLPEESDSKILSDDEFYLAATTKMLEKIKIADDVFKKK
jgi:hypothetical protein